MKKDSPSEIVRAFTEDQIERLTGVSKSQLRYWDKTDFFSPSLFYADPQLHHPRVYTFRDLVSLKVLNQIRNEGQVPLGLLRRLKEQWSTLGDDVWIKQTLYVLNKRVLVDTAEGFEDAESRQKPLIIPIKVVAEQLERNVTSLFKRNRSQVGKIEKRRNVSHNKAVLAGTRIPVKSIKAFHDEGYTTEQILFEYPTLEKKDVEAAIRYKESA